MGLVAGPVAQPIVRPVVGGWRTLSRRFAAILKGRTAIVYDPQDLASMYQGATGTLPVYRPGSGQIDPPVGLLLDKSGGGHHASQNTPTARPKLSCRYNQLDATETLSTQSVTTAATDYTLRFEDTGTVTLSGAATGVLSAGTHTITCTAGTLTCTVAGSVVRADLRAANDGVGLPPYQRVDDANTYDTVGFPLYLKFDGVDDLLQAANVDLSGTDEVTVATVVRKIRYTSAEVIVEHGGSPVANTQAFQLTSFNQAPSAFYYRYRGGGVYNSAFINEATYYAPKTVTLIGSGKLSNTEIELTANGYSFTGSAAASGGTFKSAPLSMGAQVGGTLGFQGRIYQLCIIGSLLSAAEQAVLERYLNAKTRAY